MSMSRKDYQQVADVLNAQYFATAEDEFEAREAISKVAYNLAHEFGKSNPRFDGERFAEAVFQNRK